MQTQLTDVINATPERDELLGILRACVHCGFCNAACPTYLEQGNELDGPRGRIYLMKQALEGQTVTRTTQQHLDHCLTCRACETACPSGVQYGRLLDISRPIIDGQVGRKLPERLLRGLITRIFPYRRRFSALLAVARLVKPLLPAPLKQKIPPKPAELAWPKATHSRKMLVLSGCVQATLAPQIDAASARVLDKLGIALLPVGGSGCCGALHYHLADHPHALAMARKNIDACQPYIEQGAEAIVMTASACGVMAKDYGTLLHADPHYAEKARRFSALTKDLSEVLMQEDLRVFSADHRKIAFQAPCTLQHGQRLSGVVETLLQTIGYQLVTVADGHLCCGSAGVYSLLQTDMAARLRDNKLQALEAGQADIIATANIGCLSHLQSASKQKVVHWIELLHD
ncbi:MAG: glycolate oxidase subunit GlcF [Methylovulum sp.]|nr:glycolate oxidase subunit GlcF [Methylovulum sp.]